MRTEHKTSIEVILPTLTEDYKAELIIVVGSTAVGLGTPDSDVDIIAFSNASVAVPGTVRHYELPSCKIAVEFYHWDWVRQLTEMGGVAAVRDLNRLRQAKVVFDPTNRFPALSPTAATIRQTLGSVESYLDNIETTLNASSTAFARDDFAMTCLAAEAAAQSAAILYLSAGPGPLYYSKPKWIRTGIVATGNSQLISAFDETQGGLSKQAVAQMLARFDNFRSSVLTAITPDQMRNFRSVRRAVWMMQKHGRDAESISKLDHISARSPCVVATSCGLEAICFILGLPYSSILDVSFIRSQVDENICARASEVLFPRGYPTSPISAKQYNASVSFVELVSRLLAD